MGEADALHVGEEARDFRVQLQDGLDVAGDDGVEDRGQCGPTLVFELQWLAILDEGVRGAESVRLET